jgi:hypothetical protein
VHGHNPIFQAEYELVKKVHFLQKWNHRHGAVITWACFNAFDLRNHPERGRTHSFLVHVKMISDETRSGKMFQVIDAMLLKRKELLAMRPQVSAQIVKADEERQLKDRKDRVATDILIVCGEHSHLAGGYWDDEEIAERSLEVNWLAILKSITSGEDEWVMVNGNPIGKNTFVFDTLALHDLKTLG